MTRGAQVSLPALLFLLLGVAVFAWILWSITRKRGPLSSRPSFADLAEDEVDGLADCPDELMPCLLDLAKKVQATPAELAEAAERMRELGKPREAKELAKLALASGQFRSEVLYPAARALCRTGEARLARDAMEDARTHREFNAAESMLYAEVLQADEAPETAVEVLRGVCDRHATSFEAHWKLGRALLDLDRPDEALPVLVKAAHLRPTNPLTFPGVQGVMPSAVEDSEFQADLAEAQQRLREEENDDEQEV